MTPNWELPQNYKLTFEVYHQSQGQGTAWWLTLKDPSDSKRCVVGYIQDATKYQIWAWNGSSEQKYTSQNSSQTGVWHEEEITVENGTLTFHDLTVTPPNVDLNTLSEISIYRSSSQYRNIKIKPL